MVSQTNDMTVRDAYMYMLFGHVARLDATTPAHQILKQVIAVKSGYQPDAVWRRAPGRPLSLSLIPGQGGGSPPQSVPGSPRGVVGLC